jgi:hypothetical protein
MSPHVKQALQVRGPALTPSGRPRTNILQHKTYARLRPQMQTRRRTGKEAEHTSPSRESEIFFFLLADSRESEMTVGKSHRAGLGCAGRPARRPPRNGINAAVFISSPEVYFQSHRMSDTCIEY